ncbi:MAG: hypothetical protein ACPIA7_08565 [Akkermansiaceae bacterium]
MPKTFIENYFFRDLAEGMQQQMYFWGQDVLRAEGNFLVREGFERSRSEGLKGTSCYRLAWQNGHIELYGACAGWYGGGRGFTFIRPRKRCVIWLSDQLTPVPGAWRNDLISKATTKHELYEASLPFLDWLISYEKAVTTRYGSAYRLMNYRDYKKVPKTKAWVTPEAALQWFQCFRESPEQLVRPKKITQLYYD